MLYSVSLKNNDKYGDFIEVSDSGDIVSPFDVYNKVCALKNKFKQNNESNLKYLVFGSIMTLSKIKKWANDEYKTLPKCNYCAKLILNDVFTNSLTDKIFCSLECSHIKDREISDKLEEEKHEIDL